MWAHEVADIFRPAPGFETGDADESLLSYLDGVEHTYDAYRAKVGEPIDFDAFFTANIYHVPFGGLSQRAHFRLARREMGLTKAEAEQHWARKSKASLIYNRRMGGVTARPPSSRWLASSNPRRPWPLATASASTATARVRARSSTARGVGPSRRARRWPRRRSRGSSTRGAA